MVLNILSKDVFYFDRLGKAFEKAFPGEIEFHMCRDSGDIRQGFPVVADKSPAGGSYDGPAAADAVFTDGTAPEEDGAVPQINKYSSVSSVYHSLRSLYCTGNEELIRKSGCRTLLFTSAAGGTGVSTVAAAAALAGGNGTFFLSLEAVNGTAFFESGDGKDLGDALFSALSTHGATAERILASVAGDPCGVSFFRNPHDGRDREGIGEKTLTALITAVKNSGDYGLLCIDMPFGYNAGFRKALDLADALVCVSNGQGYPSAKNQAVKDFCRLSGKPLYEITNRAPAGHQESRGMIFIDDFENCSPDVLIRRISPQLCGCGGLFRKEESNGNTA